MPPPTSLPFREHRGLIAQYLRGIAFPSASVAGKIIAERLPPDGARHPVRPSLVLWACEACGGDVADAVPVAAAFVLFDRFMVLHGELAGDSGATLARWGLGQSLNAGDALYAAAFRTLTSDVGNAGRRLEAARLVGRAVLAAIEHQDGARTTAGLTGAALRAGAVIGGASPSVARSFARAGRLLGIAASSGDTARAAQLARQAVSALAPHVSPRDLAAVEEVARYVAQRAA